MLGVLLERVFSPHGPFFVVSQLVTSLGSVQMTLKDIARFWRHVNKLATGGCWLWTASVDGKGYGQFRLAHRTVRAHRLSYRITRGVEAPDTLLHSCDIRRCVNLSNGSQADNIADMWTKDRGKHGEKHYRALMSADTARAISRAPGTAREVAQLFNVSIWTVHKIRQGKQWRRTLERA